MIFSFSMLGLTRITIAGKPCDCTAASCVEYHKEKRMSLTKIKLKGSFLEAGFTRHYAGLKNKKDVPDPSGLNWPKYPLL